LSDPSRVFWQIREADSTSNEDTQFFPLAGESSRRISPLRYFRDFYRPISRWVSACEAPGLVLAAVGKHGIEAKAYLRAKTSGINTAIVGRHRLAEVLLGGDPAISLRHLAVILHPWSGKDLRFRLLDLRTGSGFIDAGGVHRRAVEADAPYVAICGDYALVLAPALAPRAAWPADPDRFTELLNGDVLTSPEAILKLPLDERDGPIGELVVSSPECVGAVPVSRRAVSSGILLGRSERCDGDALLVDRRISRVHLLIIEVAGRLYAIDTASKNGVYGGAGSERATVLESGTRLSLGGFATVEWRFFH
jgi:hypothetical protein